jgi:hypothetical protein
MSLVDILPIQGYGLAYTVTRYLCKGKCKEFEAHKIPGKSHYFGGVRRCKRCDIYLKVPEEQRMCPCCGLCLRRGPKNKTKRNKQQNHGLIN